MSRFCHLSFLVLLASLLTRTIGHTENVTEHITIKKQDGVTNRTAECSSSKNDVMEEKKKLLRIFCLKEGDNNFQLIPRSVWAEVTGENGSHTSDDEDLFRIYRKDLDDKELTTLRGAKQAELLLVSVHFHLASNFFIENDGRIFEWLGWNNVSYGYSGGLGDRALMIVFVHRKGPNPTPSEAAIRAYESLVRYAICTGRLPTDYLLIPYHLIWDREDPEGSSDAVNYESNLMREWNAYTDNVDFLFPPESDVDQVLHVVSREEWMRGRPNSTMYFNIYTTRLLDHPASRVVVSSFGPRCFRDCEKFLKWIDEDIENRDMEGWNFPFNFIITESEWVYEAIGWNHTFRRGVDPEDINILFLGTFDTYSPHRPALNALNKIIDEGLKNGNIIPDYQITTTKRAGQGLYQDISKMDRFYGGV